MRLNANKISARINSRLDSIGIRSSVGGKPSETSELVKLIVREVIFAIQQEAVVSTIVNTVGSPTNHTGTGTGKIT
jgi:hypothetical protein